LAIFSSGSVKAQGLFLGHTETLGAPKDGGERKEEDIRGLFAANFDTVNAGAKGEVDSYVKIVKELHVGRAEVLFLSDNVTEVRAALKAGLQSLVVDRPGNAPLTEEDRKELTVITSFDAIETD